MLEAALRAKLPMISVRTDDMLNVERTLAYLSGSKEFKRVHPEKLVDERDMGLPGHVWMWADQAVPALAYKRWYEHFAQRGSVLVLVNVDDPGEAFDAGVVPVPRPLAEEALEGMTEDLSGVLDVLGGLTLRELKEVAVLAMVEHGDLSPASVTDIRRRLVSSTRGLYQVDTQVPFYWPQPALNKWLAVDGQVWGRDLSVRLRPKGLLLTGLPGTGKTLGAKYLARELGVPLYRLDLGAIFQRYVGDSEENMRAALAEVDRAQPCVLLVDEVEKALRTQDDNAVASRILGSLLWWMQERRSRVLVLMTTNDEEALPPELVRKERLDGAIKFDYISGTAVRKFVGALSLSLVADDTLNAEEGHEVMEDVLAGLNGDPASAAKITTMVNEAARRKMVER